MMFRYQKGDRPLDGFTIQYALGRGGFGEVYYAQSDAGRQVALKEIQNYEDIELRGIGHCMNLKSQHLVSIFDVKHAADGTPWVIMEYVAGPSLRAILDDAPAGIGPEKSAFFVRELAKGLTYLHGAGVVHRDLKPHNVFFEDGIVKIGDYSLSKVITSSHRSGHTMTVGSVHYMAPEISMGSYDKTVDIYALGVMLHEMMTGTPPFVGQSMGEVLMKHLSAEPDVSRIAQPFAGTIQKAMARDPKDRFQTTQAMAESLLGASHIHDLTGAFGPTNLSVVSHQAVRHAHVVAGSASTDRIRDAMAPTQPGVFRQFDYNDHPMYWMGRGIRKFAIATAIIPEDRPSKQMHREDPVRWAWRFMLAMMTLLIVVSVTPFVSGFTEWYEPRGPSMWATGHEGSSIHYFGPLATTYLLALSVLAGSVLARIAIRRSNSFSDPISSRIINLVACAAAYIALIPLHILLTGKVVAIPLLAIGFPLVVQDWCQLTRPLRSRRIRLVPALLCGLLAIIAGIFYGLPISGSAIAIGCVLAVQVAAPFLGAHGDESQDNGIEVNTQSVAAEAIDAEQVLV